MSVSRWIKFPLLFAVLMTLPAFIAPQDVTFLNLLTRFATGAIAGLGLQAWSDVRARRRANGLDDPDIYKVRQERTVTVLLGRDKAFQLCLEAMLSIEGTKLKLVDEANGKIIGRTRLRWESLGCTITLNLATIGDNLTEVNIKTRPVPRTARVDNGQGWEYAELLVSYLRRNDGTVGEALLEEGASIINDAAHRPLEFVVPEERLR